VQVVPFIYDVRPYLLVVLFLRYITHMLFNQSHQESLTIDFNKGVIFSDSFASRMFRRITKFVRLVVGSRR